MFDGEQNRAYAAGKSLAYPILLDNDAKVAAMYSAKSTPHMFVIDKSGTLVYAGAIDDDPEGKKKERRNYVAEAVDAVLAGKEVPTPKTKSYGCAVKNANLRARG
jgi:peroxiredoxin